MLKRFRNTKGDMKAGDNNEDWKWNQRRGKKAEAHSQNTECLHVCSILN